MLNSKWIGLLALVWGAVGSSLPAPGQHLELLDQGYDFGPNMISSSSVQPVAHQPRPSKPQSEQDQTSRSARNPLQRFVSDVVAQKAAVRNKQQLHKVSEQYAKNKQLDAQRLQAAARAEEQARRQALRMREKVTALKRETQVQQKALDSEKRAKKNRRVRAEKTAITQASEKTTKLAESVNLPDSPPIAKGQGAAVPSNGMVSEARTDGPPPENGVPDGLHGLKHADHGGHPTLRESGEVHPQYDVAAAEARAEQGEQASLNADLGQGQHDSDQEGGDESSPLHLSHTQTFMKTAVFKNEAAKAELKLYQKQVQAAMAAKEGSTEKVDEIELGEMEEIKKAVARAADRFIQEQNLGKPSPGLTATSSNAVSTERSLARGRGHNAQRRAEETARLPIQDSLAMLDLSPSDAQLDESVAKMKELSKALSNAAAEKRAGLKMVKQRLSVLAHELGDLAQQQASVRNGNKQIVEEARSMEHRELGENMKRERGRALTHDDLGEEADVSSAVNLLSLGPSEERDSLLSMRKQETDIESEVDKLGQEEAQIQRTAQKKAAAKQEAADHEKNVQERSHKFDILQKKKQAKAQSSDANLLAEEARLRMTTASQVEAEEHLAAALAEKRQHEVQRSKQSASVAELSPMDQTREQYQRMYLQNAEDQAAQAKTDLGNKLRDLRGNDRIHLEEGLKDAKLRKVAVMKSISKARELRQELMEDQELGESLDNTRTFGLLRKGSGLAQKDLDKEQKIHVEAQSVLSKLQALQSADMGVASLAKKALAQPVGHSENGNTKLLASESSERTHLRLQLLHFHRLGSDAGHLETTVHQLLGDIERASRHEASARVHMKRAKNSMHRISGAIADEASELETQDEDEDLGESSSVASASPIQQDLNWEHQKLIDAQSQIEQIKLETPKMVAVQIQKDKKKFGKILNTANSQVGHLSKHLQHIMSTISPQITDEATLMEKVREEHDQKDRYVDTLSSIQRDMKVANKDTQDASRDISAARERLDIDN